MHTRLVIHVHTRMHRDLHSYMHTQAGRDAHEQGLQSLNGSVEAKVAKVRG